jgi:hypothetical protein
MKFFAQDFNKVDAMEETEFKFADRGEVSHALHVP